MSLWHDNDQTVLALRRDLEARGLPTAIDTVALQRSLTLLHDADLPDDPRAVFQFAGGADAAMRLLVDGRWPDHMPARVLVLPADEAAAAGWLTETLGQIGVRILLSEETGDDVVFAGLDALLADLP